MRRSISLTAALCLVAAVAAAQHGEAKKPLSPPAKAAATIGGKSVTIDYSAPSKRNRVIMGELVPYGKVWRTGANAATTLKTDAEISDLFVRPCILTNLRQWVQTARLYHIVILRKSSWEFSEADFLRRILSD